MNLRRLPKVELHRHLEGCVRYATYVDIAREAGLDPLPPAAIHSVPSDRRTLRTFLAKFGPLRALYPSREAIQRVAREAIEDAARDSIHYIELRFSPVHFARRMRFDPVRVAEWIIDASRREARRSGMIVNFLITLGRDFDRRTNEPSLRAAVEHRPAVVGLDIAGLEESPMGHLEPLIRLGRRAGLRLTIHAGEGGPGRNVVDAVRRYGAERIGHGTRFRGLLPGVAFECSLTSNLRTGACRTLSAHPLRRWFDLGLSVSLNTDDPAMFGTSLTREYETAHRSFGFTAEDFAEMNRRALAAAFR